MNNYWESGESGGRGAHAQHNAEQRWESVSTNFPKSDAARQVWFNNFAFTIATHATHYGLAFGDVGKLFQLAAEFDRTFALAQSPRTRSPLVIAKKSHIRTVADTVFREYANRIKTDSSISTADKLALGFRITSSAKRSAAAAPKTAPVLHVLAARDGAHELVCADGSAPHRRGKPKGVACLELRIVIAPPASGSSRVHDPDSPPEGAIVRTERITRMRFTVEHDREQASQTVTYFGRWQTRSGKTGPWSMLLAMTVVAGHSITKSRGV